MSESGKLDVKTFLIVVGVVTVLLSPMVFIGMRVSRWFRAISQHTEGSTVQKEAVDQVFVLKKPVTLQRRRQREAGGTLEVAAGTEVEAAHSERDGRPIKRTQEDGKEVLMIRYHVQGEEHGSYYGWVPVEDLETKAP